MDAGLNPIWRLLPRLAKLHFFHLQKYNPVPVNRSLSPLGTESFYRSPVQKPTD